MRRCRLFPLLLSALVLLAACGGGTSSSTRPPENPSTAPKITSAPPVQAEQGVTYTYNITTDTNAALQLVAAPQGATLSGNTLTWTPTAEQARIANGFTVRASAGGASSNQTWNLTPIGTVEGTSINTRWTETGTVTVPKDLSAEAVELLYPQQDGTMLRVSGIGRADGSFAATKIPGGKYWLRIGDYYYWTSESRLDLGYDTPGREGYQTGSSTLNLDLAGFYPFTQQEYIWISVANIGFGTTAFPPASTGDLRMTEEFGPRLADATQGDRMLVGQFRRRAVSGIELSEMIAMAGPLAVTMPNGGSVQVTGTATIDPTQTGTFRANIKGSSFAAMAPLMNPQAEDFYNIAVLSVQPLGPSTTNFGAGLSIVDIQVVDPVADVDAGDVPWKSFYPASWPKYLYAQQSARVMFTAPGAVTPGWLTAMYQQVTTAMPSARSPISVALSPPTNVTIDGRNAFAPGGTISTRPKVRWTASTGLPVTSYVVSILKVYVNDALATRFERVASIWSPHTTVEVPPGILVPGTPYVFTVAAEANGRVDYATAPHRRSFPWAQARMISDIVYTE